MAVYGFDNVVSLVDVATGRILRRYDTDGPGPTNGQFFALSPLAFSPDGRTLAVGAQTYSSPPLVLLDGHTLRPPAHPAGGFSAAARQGQGRCVLCHGRRVAASFLLLTPGPHPDGDEPIVRTETRVWDLSHLQRRPKTIRLPWGGYGETMALSPHGGRVYLSAPVAAYSVRTGERLWRAHVAATWLPLDLSPDGRHLAVVPNHTGLAIALISTRHGRVERILRGASGIVGDVTFSDDGSQVAAVSERPRAAHVGPQRFAAHADDRDRRRRRRAAEPGCLPRLRVGLPRRDRGDLGPRRLRVIPAARPRPFLVSPPPRSGSACRRVTVSTSPRWFPTTSTW